MYFTTNDPKSMRRLATVSACLITLSVALVACDVFETDLDQVNPQEPTEATYYQNLGQLETGVAGIYEPLEGLWQRSYYFAHDLLSHDAYGMGSLISNLIPINNRVHGAGNGVLNDHWNAFYEAIKNANNIIAAVQGGVEGVSESDLARIEAEARFLRALSYYELVTKYGDVPLILEVKTEPGGGAPRAPQSQIYTQILDDLSFAQENLPRKSELSQPGRATRGAAYALEGETQLFLGSLENVSVDQGQSAWEEARAAFQTVIESGEYRLVDNYFDNFAEGTENNAESIFEIQFLRNSSLGTNGRREYEYGMLGWRNTTVHPHAVLEFEDGDPRRGETMFEVCDEFNNGELVKTTSRYEEEMGGCDVEEGQELRTVQNYNPDWKKYEYYERGGPWNDTDDGINLRVIRYAEVLVGLAEAQIELGNRTSTNNASPSAQALLNQVRSRPSVDVEPYPTENYDLSSYENAIETLYHEYSVEFTGEQVYYPAQLRSWEHPDRKNYLEPRLQPVQLWPDSPGFDPTRGQTEDQTDRMRRYWPIPRSEIESNPEISESDQNPGY
jgi:hypothetical protein